MTGQRQPTFATWLPTRRRVLVGAGCAFAGFAANPHHVCSSPGDDVSRTAESIHQEPVFKASRKVLYEALTQAAQFDKVTKLSAAMQTGTPPGMAPTEISREVGGSFLLFGGHILGRQVELVPNERLRYSDKFDDPNLPGDIQVTVTLKKVSIGTEVNIVQEGLPDVIPPEGCYLGWQDSLRNLARLVEPEINQ